jgi:hypothetical protein
MRRPTYRMLWVAGCVACFALAGPLAWSQSQLGQGQVPADPTSATPPPPPTPVAGQLSSVGQDASIAAPPGQSEPLVRGPVHEGFAEMVTLTPQPTAPVAGQPPQPINELPAEVRPDSANAEWLPGYWGWDGDTKHFIWISGTWRVPPPGTRWVPGYWTTSAAGAQRVPGFWVPEETEQVNYLPAPPAYQDEGVDPDAPPSPDVFWVPGYWGFANRKYAWEAGYWARMVQGWMWIAAHYAWTPDGYVFVEGRWDLPLDQRGMLFAPVAFPSPLYQQAGFTYNPAYLLDLGLLASNLFVDPAFQDYYFGDYYGNQYQQAGIYPWYAVGTGAYLYDPIFGYQSWFDRRRNPRWRDELRQRYDRFVRDPAARPPRTWRDEQRLARAGAHPGGRYRPWVTPVEQALRDNRLGQHFVRLNDAQRREARQNIDLRRRMAVDRSHLEHRTPTVGPEKRPNTPSAQRTFRLPPVRTTATRPAPEEREQVRPGPAAHRGERPRIEPGSEPRTEPRVDERRVEERRVGPPANQGRMPPAAPHINQPPRRPERVATPPRSAPPARRPAPAPRQEKRP